MNTHRFDGVSFFSGLIITLLGLVFLIPNAPSDVFDAISKLGNWFWPILFLAVGIGILIPVLIPSNKHETGEPEKESG
jgi:hypothetical protein